MKWLAAFLMLAPMPVLALSCLPFGITDAYLHAQSAQQEYVIVQGNLHFDTARMPKSYAENNKKTNRIPGFVKGQVMTRRGAGKNFRGKIQIHVQCAGPWCGGLPRGDGLMFLRRAGKAYVLDVGACQSFAFPQPSQQTHKQLRACMRGRKCEPSARRR